MASNVTNVPLQIDRRVLGAARSLDINRRNKEIVEGRIDRATDTIMAHLAIHGLGGVRLGLYEIELENGGLRLTKLPAPGSDQLELPRINAE